MPKAKYSDFKALIPVQVKVDDESVSCQVEVSAATLDELFERIREVARYAKENNPISGSATLGVNPMADYRGS